MKRLIPFNINKYIRVKFSPASLDLWRDRAKKLGETFPKMKYLYPADPPLDSEGRYRGQFWSIMHLVASELQAGGSAFQDCLIEFEVEDNAKETVVMAALKEWVEARTTAARCAEEGKGGNHWQRLSDAEAALVKLYRENRDGVN